MPPQLEALYESYFLDVYRYATALCGDRTQAEDIAAETFLKALESLDSYRGDAHIRVWLCQIAKNIWHSRLRKDGKLHFTADELPAASIPGPAEQVVNADAVQRIQMLFESLPEPQRSIFSLRVFGQLSFRQIAAVYGKTENWACVTYHRARSKIREQMEDCDE